MEDKRQVKEINASSMADIAFLLLIFFLVATTMNVDTGIARLLPQIPPDIKTKNMEVKERDLLPIFINSFDQIMVGGQQAHISQVTEAVKRFIINATDDPNMPEKEVKNIDMPDGSKWAYPVSKGVISLNSDRGTSYDVYVQVQNELTRAFNEMREDVAQSKFRKSYANLSTAEQEAVADAVPQAISESEPRNTTGRN
jgi:biopolymer transport protein ExbD